MGVENLKNLILPIYSGRKFCCLLWKTSGINEDDKNEFIKHLEYLSTKNISTDTVGGVLYTTINREQVIKEVSKREGMSLSTVQSLYLTLENYIFETLSSATPTEDVNLKLFNGISIKCTYKDKKEMSHPETGDSFETDAKIWAKPKITRHYNRKLNGYFEN